MALLPARNILDGTALPVTSAMKTALGSLRDYLAGLLGTDSTDTAAARLALGAATRGANADITSLTGLTTPLSMAQGGTGMANGFVSSLAANGYQKLPSGLIIQWGSYTPVPALGSVVVTLPITAPSSVAQVIAQVRGGPVNGSSTVGGIVLNASQITLYNQSSSAQNVSWIAICY